ncbi:MAG: hypothetical protein ACRYHC_15570 [Janthinobacterium lividum]
MGGVPIEAVAIGGGSIAVVAAALAVLRRRRVRPRIDDEAAAIDGATRTVPGFAPGAAVVGHDGAAALVSGTDARGRELLVLVRAGGARLTTREVEWGAVRATPGGIVVETGERRSARKDSGVPITGVDALDVRRLAPAASAQAIAIAERLAPPLDISGVVAKPS